STSRASAITAGASGVFSSPPGGSKAGRRRPPGPRAPRARRPTRDTSRVGTGRESGTLGDPRAPHVAAGESRRDRRGTPAPPTPLCEACPARRRLAASPLRRHPPIERCAPGAYPACRAGFASRGTAVARGTVPSRSRLAPTRDMSLGSRSADGLHRLHLDAPGPRPLGLRQPQREDTVLHERLDAGPVDRLAEREPPVATVRLSTPGADR